MKSPEVPVRRFALTAASLAQYGAAAVLTAVAAVVGYASFSAWRFRAAVEEACRQHDAGNWGAVRPAAEEALRWRPDFSGARLLLAKMLCASGDFEAARREYERLRSEGYVPAPVRLGLGAVYLRLAERAAENDIAAHVLESLGVTPLYRVQPPGTLEGGDFIPCGDFVLQGQGLLTNEEGIRQCLEQRVYGYVEVAVVEDPRMDMDEMHLDTYFAVLDRDLAACVESRLDGDEEPTVKIYQPQGSPADYTYVLTRTTLFSRYLREKGIHVIPLSKAEQRDFAANGLLLAPRRLIAVTRAGDAFLERLSAAGVNVQALAFDALTGGYGGPHCSTQVLVRG